MALKRANVEKDLLALTAPLTYVKKQSVETTVHAHFDISVPYQLPSYPRTILVSVKMAGQGKSVSSIHALKKKKPVLEMESALL